MVPREDSCAVTNSRPPPHLDLAEVHARDELYQPVHTAADGSLHYSTALAAGYAQARHDDPRGKRRNCMRAKSTAQVKNRNRKKKML